MARSTIHQRVKRRPMEWAVRGGLAAIALIMGYTSTKQALALAIYRKSPDRAYALSPGDGRIAGALAEQIAAGDANAIQRAWATRLARQALVNEPLAASALTALALNTQLEGHTAAARRLFVHSDALSRRELGTRLWLIEDAVRRNDVAGALQHYDIALRTAKAAPDLLFPVLSNAIVDPAIMKSLAVTLAKRRPAWGDAFVQYLSDAQINPVISAALLRRLGTLGYPVPDTAQVGVINALVAKNALEDAWSYYASIRPGATRKQSRDPDFIAQLQLPSVFDWTPINNDAGINASVQRMDRGGIVDFAAPSTVGGVVLQQVQLLPPGRYRLEGTSAEIAQPRDARPYWQLSCMDGRELGRVEIPNSAEMNGHFIGELTVAGDNCAAQTLRLVVRASSEVGGVTGQIRHVLLAPITGKP